MSTLKGSKIFAASVRGGFHALKLAERWAGKSRFDRGDLRSARRFLFLEFSPALGTNVHATPMFEALKRAVPDAIIMVACSRIAFEVFRHNPFIDHLVETPRPPVNPLLAIRTLKEHLKVANFVPDIVITSRSNEQRSISLLAFLSGSAIRLGYTLAPELYDVVLHLDRQQSLIANNMSVIERLGYHESFPEPAVYYTRTDLEKAESLFRENGIANSPARIVCVTQTSRTQRRAWPVPQFVPVLEHLRSTYNADIIFVGTASEAGDIDSFRAQVPVATISLSGKTTIQTMAALLASSDLLLTLDSGNMHIGRSVGVPMVVLAPRWAPTIEWLPLGFDHFQVFLGDLDPSSSPGCEILQMDTRKVIEAVDHLLTTYPPSDTDRHRRAQRSLSSIER